MRQISFRSQRPILFPIIRSNIVTLFHIIQQSLGRTVVTLVLQNLAYLRSKAHKYPHLTRNPLQTV